MDFYNPVSSDDASCFLLLTLPLTVYILQRKLQLSHVRYVNLNILNYLFSRSHVFVLYPLNVPKHLSHFLHSLKTQPSDCCIHLPDIIPIGDSLKWPPSVPHFSSKSARLGVFPPISKYDLWSQRMDFYNPVSSDDASCFLLLDVYIL